MSNPSKGARLYLYKRKGRDPVYVIRCSGKKDVSTKFGPDESERANQALEKYLAAHFRPDTSQRDLAAINIGEVLDLYLTDIGPTRPANTAATMGFHVKALLPFWAEKSLAEVKGSTCRAYVKSRPVKASTARHELKELQTAINHWHRESALPAVPQVTLPPPAPTRTRYLERDEVARMLWAAHKLKLPHVARFIIIGVYSGTRHNAILQLHWMQNLAGGHVDLERSILYRRGVAERDTSKRRPPFIISKRLEGHLRRWKAIDVANGCDRVSHYKGSAITKMRRSWRSVCEKAKLGTDVTPHVLRHTFVTWKLWEGLSIWDVAGMAGADATTIERIYGHHRKIEQNERQRA